MIQSQQHMLVLRLPDDMATRMHELIKEGQQIEFAEQVSGDSGSSSTSGLDRMFMDVKPHPTQTTDGDTFVFTMEGKEYPALLSNLPTPVEVQKTFDQKTFIKSGDVGQMLHVFPTEQDFRTAKSKLCQNSSSVYIPPGSTPSPIDASLSSGLTPPTQSIVQRRYNLTRSNKKTIPPPQDVAKVVEEIGRGWKIRTVDDRELEYIDTVEEDIVDFEEWMASDDFPHGITVSLGGKKEWEENAWIVLQHPESFYQKTDLKQMLRTQGKGMPASTSASVSASASASASAGLMQSVVPLSSHLNPSLISGVEGGVEGGGLGRGRGSMESLVSGQEQVSLMDFSDDEPGESDGRLSGDGDDKESDSGDDNDWMVEDSSEGEDEVVLESGGGAMGE